MKYNKLKALPLALTLALSSGIALADSGHDEDGFHGYFRDGAGSRSGGGSQSCFGLGGNTMKYRLGNECDAYFEGGYTTTLAKAADGVVFTGTLWANAYSPHSDFADAPLKIAKAYVEAKNLDFLGGGVAWVGKRYYFRPDIHMLDLQYINMNGTGAGIDRYKAGAGTISYAVFKDNDLSVISPTTGLVTGTTAALRQTVIYEGLPVNEGGKVDAALTLIKGEGDNSHNGWQASIFHKQDVFGGGNTVGLQYGVGPGVGGGGGRIGVSGSTSLGSDVTRLRLFNDLVVQPTKQFSAEFVALIQRDKSNAGGSTTWTSLGVRPVYAFAPHFKMQMELGTDRVTGANGAADQRLTKLTIAPTISMGESYWARPELRLFVSYGKWNNAGTAAVNANNNSGPVYNNGTSGTSAGVQVEAWW